FNNIVNIIITLSDRIKQIGTPSKHPYWGTKINDTSQQHQQDFLKHLSSFKGLLKTCIEEMNKIENLTSLKIDTVSKAVQYCNLFDTLLKSHEVPLRLLTIENINNYRNELKPIFDSINSINDTKKDILINYELEILNEDLNKLRRNLKGEYSSILRIFKPQYYKDINFIKGFANKEISPFSYDEIVLDINSLISYKKLNEDINNIDKSIIEPIGDLWKSTETNVEFITNALNWLDEYNSNKISDDDDSHLKEWIRNSENISDELVDLKTKLEKTTTQAIKDKITIENDLKIDPTIIYENDFENTNLDQLLTCLKRWEDGIDNLVDWVRYRRAYEKCESVGIGKYVDEELEKSDDTSSILDKYKKKYFYGIFENLKQKHPILKDFESLIQEKLVSEFKELDKNHIQLSKYRIQKILRENRPDTNYQGTTAGELGTIQKQMRLKRGHMALRKLFNRASNVMQKINPCFMMSPMSVSQYLDPDKLSFDLVVFDEASQIKPEHSIGSIIRGKQLIVVGDEKQLPPTSFFSKELETDDDDEVTLPSILDECLTLSCFNESHLRWHYRSRDESLIQFSNLKFYNNKLYTFPSQSRTSDHTGIQFNYIEDSVYDRGGKQTNRQEADAIVDSLFEHFDTNPQLSIGIVALSSNQRRLISDILYERVYNNPKYDKFVNNSTLEEPLFIKNLETVQGDERDIIYISIGYGKDENGRLYMNFGPLNKDGGERRLNVLITRAKRKIVVFSSIKGSDFNLTQSSGVGITRLKEYLEFAESSGTKDLRSAHDISGELDMDNPFETSVAEQLTQANIKFIPQVGQSGYKIDFGIIDPSDSSKFILALECDGATYHSSHTARDRDRLRQSVLEGLGWNFHRVWSTDWFQNPAREMQRLKESIQNAKSGNTKVDVSKNKIEFDDIEIISKNISEIQIIDYKKVHIDHFSMMDQEHFYQLGDSRSTENIEYFNNIILSILKIESPMHKDELSLRVIEHFDMRTVGSRIRKIMATKTSRLKAHKKIITKSDFIYQIDQEIDFVRKQDGRDALS
ncbi:MAG: hypothetical protein H8E55_29035, partial [Pelagibacterales bacterium]|nr:hypothetical protein [Pelagibacterales bacterium]